ncbi:MAG TPA: DUF2249 domain-containing protein [Chitinophagaceae bacterium]
MTINANTKIAALLKHNPVALEAIISLSSRFEKLRNPLLRKLMAGRTSIAMASKIGGCSVKDFYQKLKPLGFEADEEITDEIVQEQNNLPDFVKNITPSQLVELDVRPIIEHGNDPLNLILQKVRSVKPQQVLKLINSFEPTPLVLLLEKQGFESYAEHINSDLVFTYFYKRNNSPANEPVQVAGNSETWDEVASRFGSNLVTIDVRQLEMPLPMITILDALSTLPEGHALFVYHKRIPLFLIPELADRKFNYRVREISDSEVHLLIYKD